MRPKIISICTTKGGAGKTSLAAGLLCYYKSLGATVCGLDADPNGNLSRWITTVEAVPDPDDLVNAASASRDAHELTVIDCAGFLSTATLYAAGVADLVLIPARTSEDDVLEAIKTRAIARNAGNMCRPTREIPYLTVLSSVQRGTVALRHARARLEAFGMATAASDLRASTQIQTARFAGTSPIEGTVWAEDIPALVREFEPWLA